MTLKGGTQGVIFLADCGNYARIPVDLKRTNWHGNACEEGAVSRGSAMPRPKGLGALQRFPILGFPLCLRPLSQNDPIPRGNIYGRMACFRGSIYTRIPRGRCSICGVRLYLRHFVSFH